MNGNSFVIDTNIALYLLSGDETLIRLLDNKQAYISFVTQLELLGYKGITKKEKETVEQFISQCYIIDLNEDIKSNVITIRQNHSVKLPDAIIAGTAQHLALPLITADKGFIKIDGLDILIYEKSSN